MSPYPSGYSVLVRIPAKATTCSDEGDHSSERSDGRRLSAGSMSSTPVLLDDIGYLQQDREEMEVLFTFLAERYERKSVLITSNLVFSQWDQIFKNPMTTAAAIDRLVHHAVILEMTGPSQRSPAAAHAKSNTEVESA